MRVGRFIRGCTISDAWYRGLSLIWRSGQELVDERNTRIKEIIALEVVVEDTNHDLIPDKYGWSRDRLEEYAAQLLNGGNPGFVYTYGQRLRAWTVDDKSDRLAVDQIEYVIDRLSKSSKTRRASAVTWIPPIDTAHDEVPCMMVVDFKIRDGLLNLTAFFRSHDFAGAYPANLYGLTGVLRHVASGVGVKTGSITTLSASAHIYEHDWDFVYEIITGKQTEC